MKATRFVLVLTVLIALVSMARLGNFPAYAGDIDGECKSVTCADGSVHPCGFDCSTLYDTGGGGGYGTGGGGGYTPPSGPSREELARQRRWQQAYDLNQEANKYYEKRDFAKAAELYQKALSIDPNRPVIRENLQRAETWLQKEREAKAREAEKKQKMRQAEDRVHGMLDNLSLDFDGSRGRASALDEGSGAALDFIGAKDPLFSKGTKTSAPPDLQFMDAEQPLIVDPRVAKGEMTAEEAKAVRAKETERDLKASASVASAVASIAEGDYESGISYLKKALETKPGDVTIQKQLGYAYYLRDQERIKGAANPKVNALLDALEVGRGNWKTSIDYLQAVYQGDPSQKAHRHAYYFLQGLSGYYAGPLEAPKDKAPPPIDDKTKQFLIDTTVEAGRFIKEERDVEKAYALLEQALDAHPEAQAIRDLLHFAEGLVAAKNTEEITRVPKIFEPTAADSEGLLEAVAQLPKRSFREIVVEQLERCEKSLADYLYDR